MKKSELKQIIKELIKETHYTDVPRDEMGRVNLDDITYEMKEAKGKINKIIATTKGKQSEVFTKLVDKLTRLKALEEEIEKINEEVKQEGAREKIAALFGAEFEFSTRVVRTVSNIELVLSAQPKAAETVKWAQVYKDLVEELTPQLIRVAEAIVQKNTTTQSPKPPSLKIEPISEGVIADLWKGFINKLKTWGRIFDKKMSTVEKNMGELHLAPEYRVRSDEPTSPYYQDNIDERYDDYEDDMRGDVTNYEKTKGIIGYTDESTGQVYEYNYSATMEFYKGQYNGSEIDKITPDNPEVPEFDKLPKAFKNKIIVLIKQDIEDKL